MRSFPDWLRSWILAALPCVGLGGTLYETAFRGAERKELLAIYLAMLGLSKPVESLVLRILSRVRLRISVGVEPPEAEVPTTLRLPPNPPS